MKKENKQKGISMIVVLWVVTILTVVVAATALMTYSDITSAINLKKRYIEVRAVEVPSDFVISYLPKHKDLHELDSLFFKEDYNKVFYENNGIDTVFSIPFYLSADNSIIGCLALPDFIDFNKDSSLIVSSSTVGYDSIRVNPEFHAGMGVVLYYRTRAVIESDNDIVGYRRVRNASAFTEGKMGHTIY